MPAISIRFSVYLLNVFRVIIIFNFTLFSNAVFGQEGSELGVPEITAYKVKNITDAQIWSISQDKRGFMYFGTSTELRQYDGSRWQFLKVSHSGTGQTYRALEADSNGRIYYGSARDIGYLHVDSVGKTRKHSLISLVPEASRNFQDTRAIHITPKGLYFQSRENIIRIAPDSTVKVWNPASLFLYSFYLDNELYVHEHNRGLLKLINDSLHLLKGSEHLGRERMQVMLPFDDGSGVKKYLLGLFNIGLFIYDGSTFKKFVTEADPYFGEFSIYKGIVLPDGNFAIGTIGAGVIIIDHKGKIVQHITKKSGLPDDLIYSFFLDRDKNLWIGEDFGLAKMRLNSPVTSFGSLQGIHSTPLSTTRFEGDIYVGTSSGLLKLNRARHEFEIIKDIPSAQVFELLVDGDQLLISGDGFYALKKGKTTLIKPSSGGDFSVTTFFKPPANRNLLFTGNTESLGVFYRDSIKPGSQWEFIGRLAGIQESIWSLSEDSDHPGEVWAGTQANKVYKISFPLKGKPTISDFRIVKSYSLDPKLSYTGQVVSFRGHAYFPGDSAFYRFDYNKEVFYQDTTLGFFTEGGGNLEAFILEDYKRRIWVRMGRETRIFTPSSGGYTVDSTSMDWIGQTTVSQIRPEANNIIWMAVLEGLIRYDDSLATNTRKNFPAIIRLVSNGKTAYNPELDQTAQNLIRFEHKNNALRFDYTAPYYDNEQSTEYQTWLEGYDDNWSSFAVNNYKEYTNLPSGKYTFHVRAINVYGTVSEEASYSFVITTPWYFTWWAWTIYVLSAIGLVYLLVRWRTSHLHDQHRELEKIVNERTSELSQRVEELAVINSVQEGLVREHDMDSIYKMVGEKIREIFNAQVIDIVTYDDKNSLIEDRYAYEKGDLTLLGPRSPQGFRQTVINTGETLILNKSITEQAQKEHVSALIGEIPKSLLIVPMKANDKVIGMISLQDLDKENAFTDYDVHLLKTLANSMSVALESANRFNETKRLLKETEQRNAQLAVINSVQDGLVREMNMQGIFDLVGEKIRQIFNAQVIDIVMYDKETNLIEDKYAFEKGDRSLIGPREPKGFRKHLIQDMQPIFIKKNYEEVAKKYNHEIILGDAPKSAAFVPLIAGNEVKGIISLQNLDNENAFSDADHSLLTTLSNSMSVALESARLFDETTRLLKETEQRTAELGVINSVQEGLVREMNADSIYEMVGEKLREIFNVQVVDIVTYDKKANTVEDRYAYEKGDRSIVPAREPYGIRKHIIETRQPLLINSNMKDYEKQFVNPIYFGQGAKSAIFVPMLEGNEVIGIVSLQNLDEENAFTETDMRMLVTLSSSLSIALQNARLFDETTRLLAEAKQRTTELQTVNHVSRTLASQLNPDDLIVRIGDQMKELFKANIVYLALLNEKTKLIHFPYQFGEVMPSRKLGEGLTSQILITGESLLLNSEIESTSTALGFQRIGLPAASYLGVPIPDGDKIIGVLSVQSTEHENRFTENDQRLLSTIASSVGVALRNARLFEEVQLAKFEAETATQIAEKANEAKSAFLSTVSHELRTPLTSVLGFAKIIRKRLEEKIFPNTNQSDPRTGKAVQQISENLNVVVAEGERLTHLINDVLDLAKIEAGKMEWSEEWVAIHEIIERAASATSALFDQKNLTIEKTYAESLPEIRGDRDKLIQVVVNLLSNAVKFTDSGKVTCNVHQNNNEIIVDITDTGIGIAAHDHAAVFEQFRQVGDTLTDKPKGTGLGLPICKEIIEHHGGKIWLNSEPGKGSTFSFSIPVQKTGDQLKPVPLNDLVAQLKEQMAQSKLNNKTQTSTILIVDDDHSIRSLLYQELSDAGYLIEEATNGKEALVSIRANRPDLVILDVMMPEMNGFDVAAVLKNDPQTMDIPIIVLSIVQDKARGFRIGVDRYLTKPIDTGILFSEVDSLLQQGRSRKKVLVVDEDQNTVRTLVDVLKSKGYQVVESDGKELLSKAIDTQPDIIILNSVFNEKAELSQSLRMEKGMENVLFLVYQ